MDYALKYTDLLKVIIWEMKLMTKLFGEDERNSWIINRLSRYDDDSIELYPQQKELLKETGLKRKELIDLMSDLVGEFYLKTKYNYQIIETEIVFNIHTLDGGYFHIVLHDLDYIPRLGETISFPMFRTDFDSVVTMKINEVNHSFENQKHTISISATHW